MTVNDKIMVQVLKRVVFIHHIDIKYLFEELHLNIKRVICKERYSGYYPSLMLKNDVRY